MAHAGQVFEGPNGYRLTLIATAAETGGELLEMEASYAQGGGGMPPEHYHPSQDERFEVLEGAVLAVVGGEERRYEAGESFDVPAGVRHQMTGDGPARVRWQVRPAMRTAEFFERLYGPDSPVFKDGEGAAELFEEFGPEIRF